MRFETILKEALEREITKEEALFLFENSYTPNAYLRLFQTANAVREGEAGSLFLLDGWMGGLVDCKINPPCRYCGRAIPWRRRKILELTSEHLEKIAEVVRRTGTEMIQIGGGTNYEEAPAIMIRVLRELKKHGFQVRVNVGPALKEEDIREMKAIGVNEITCSFETINEEIFRKLKPGDSLAKRKDVAHIINDSGVSLSSNVMIGVGESYRDRVEHLFYLKGMENLGQVGITWLRIHPGSPLEGKTIPPSPLEAARTIAISRLIFRNKWIKGSNPQYLQLWIAAGANRQIHGGISVHRKEEPLIGGGGAGMASGIQHIEVCDGIVVSNMLPVTARWVMASGMQVTPSIQKFLSLRPNNP